MASSEEIQTLILTTLDTQGNIENTDSLRTADGAPIPYLAVVGVLNSLASKQMVTYTTIEKDHYSLTAEGNEIADSGSHEAKVFNAVDPKQGITIAELTNLLGPSAKIGQGKAFKNKWIKKESDILIREVTSIVDLTQQDVLEIRETGTHSNPATLKDLQSRKHVEKAKLISYSVSKGPKFSLTIEKQATDLTADMLANGSWRTLTFKKYNFAGNPPQGGHLHPLMKVREEFRKIFFELGFEEMPTNKYVESSFWNFDALFQPQQHPARDAHDTFFLLAHLTLEHLVHVDPATSSNFSDMEYVNRVKEVHSHGGYGSIGYGYDWKIEEAEKLILRTHTTSVSSNMLYRLAQETKANGGVFRPAKFFSIDRVYRNETVDATHLAEFHQVEGVIADKNLTLGDLIGFMQVFFEKMGIPSIKFKPAFNPYTEPSMEIFSWHPGLEKWVELGNSGMFRPEMLGAMGLDPDVRVIAWGLGLERPTMIKYGLDNIRELLGHKVDLDMIQSNSACRLDKKMGKELVGRDAVIA
ncbi:Phenylalanyl-tRNA synthetase, beta subunit, cytoplasmic [Modicella reniformis]|uniref:Probable phenylalanine--tRNA ligase alpha subunit n=1 Tax=Modicella reniformis TaxID=1440133 RepID=A0A9P6SUX2_9FUNG|nr:Phenylalanyl-tRNA synthetase, beta subunit, cytoplasmic [Modicella reniformis]